jgi:ATP-binding cassette subfamily C protein CydCD
VVDGTDRAPVGAGRAGVFAPCRDRLVVDRAARAAAGSSVPSSPDLMRRFSSPADRRPATGETAVLVTRGVAAAEPYLTRYLPGLVLAAVLPCPDRGAIATQDVTSAVIVLATLPLVPVFGALVGLATARPCRAAVARHVVAVRHFLDVMRGLPTLVAFRRAEAQSARIREVTDRYRAATLRTLRIAFAASAVLELVATLSVALVAVTVGVRLAGGGLDLRTALVVLLLAPEAYWPLRRVGPSSTPPPRRRDVRAVDCPARQRRRPTTPRRAPRAGDLVVDDVTVTYPGRVVPALDAILVARAGHRLTAVTGPSGCGKSTLLSCSPACASPTAAGGVARAPGRRRGLAPAWRCSPHGLSSSPALVPTTSDSAPRGRATTPCGRSRAASPSRRRVRALPRASRHPLGEDGATLSAGERARLALARIVLADRPLRAAATSRPPTSTTRPSTSSPTPSSSWHATAPSSWSRTGRLWSGSPTTWSSRTARQAAPDSAPVLAAAPAGAPGRHRLRRGAPRPGSSCRQSSGPWPRPSGVALTATSGLAHRAGVDPAGRPHAAGRGSSGFAPSASPRPLLLLQRAAAGRTTPHSGCSPAPGRRVRRAGPLTPGRLGPRRGDVLASVVDDVDSVLDRELRCRLPVRGLVIVAASGDGVTGALTARGRGSPSADLPARTLSPMRGPRSGRRAPSTGQRRRAAALRTRRARPRRSPTSW